MVFLTAPEGVVPAHDGSSALLAGDDEGCGSIVFFNQASMYMSSETGFPTLGAARAAGQTGKACFPASAQEAFLMHGLSLLME
jgi:hypothetical protein